MPMYWCTASYVWLGVISVSVTLKKLNLPTNPTIKPRGMPFKGDILLTLSNSLA